MTLGDIIKLYVLDHSMNTFLKNSGMSRAYVYLLMKGKNNNGTPIRPTFDTIQRVADGVEKTFDEVFNQLDYDFEINVRSKKCEEEDVEKHNDYVSYIKDQSIQAKRNRITQEELSLLEKIRSVDEEYMPFVMSAIDTAIINSETKRRKKTEDSAL